MAGPDPRRSSRARTGQSQSQRSSTASSTSGRAERNMRSFNKTGSPQKSTPTASLSSEPLDEAITNTDDPHNRTRRTRTKDEDQDQTSVIASEIEMAHGADDLQEDDEAVRCICGQDDYPGPPSADDLKEASKDGFDLDAIFPPLEVITEDLAGFYVQCDICKVWQHGACVGLINDDTLPEYYYCDECRKDLHKIFKSTNGPRFSIYLPLNRGTRSPSPAKDGTRSPKPREGKLTRLSAAAQTASKRRSTMNSRDAAYDEEQLLKAIEASKEEVPEDVGDAARRTKRSRSDSEEKQEAAKRQRTGSGSRSPSPTVEKQLAGEESDDAGNLRNGSSKKSRSAAAARNQREKAEKEERERQRAEAANKRKGRAERRRADDSDPLEDVPLATRAVPSRTTAPTETVVPPPDPPPSSQPTPDTPPANPTAPSGSKSKGGRPTHRKKGRNQYTRDKEGREDESPPRSQSRDVQENNTGGGASKAGGPENGKATSKARGGMNSRVTMSEMKRRAAAMFDYIGKTQVELAGEPEAAAQGSPGSSKGEGAPAAALPLIRVNGGGAKASPAETADRPQAAAAAAQNGDRTDASKRFKELSCVEMMDFLTRDLVHWQGQFAA